MGTRMKNQEAVFVFVFVFVQIAALCSSSILSTNSRWIVDNASGNRVKLTCVNWPSHLEPMIADGLEKKPLFFIAKKVAQFGFNCVRFTWPTYMFTRPEYGNLRVSASLDKWGLRGAKVGIRRHNPHFLNMTVLEVHHAVVNELGRHNVKVVLDNHVSLPTWCCDWKDGNGFFGDTYFNPDEWLRGLAAVARAYKGNPAVIGMSLRNELRGPRQNENDWYKYMQQGAETVHRENPDLLVIVSGLTYAGDLRFLKRQPLAVNITNKLVYEAHWYSFGTSSEQWTAQTNNLCAGATQSVRDKFVFLTAGNNPFPLFLSEFGINLRGDNEADNRYIGCLLATVAETDNDWGLWALQGSYMLRQGTANLDEVDGVFDFNWDRPRNPNFLQRLQAVRQTNQDFRSRKPTLYKLFHPLSGQCVHIRKGVFASSCDRASLWEQHQDGGLIKLSSNPRCLGVAGEGASPSMSRHCSRNNSKWKYVSSTGLHLAAQDDRGRYLCLEKNGSGSQIVTKKCLCVGDNLADLPTCRDNPQSQWFKLVPANAY